MSAGPLGLPKLMPHERLLGLVLGIGGGGYWWYHSDPTRRNDALFALGVATAVLAIALYFLRWHRARVAAKSAVRENAQSQEVLKKQVQPPQLRDPKLQAHLQKIQNEFGETVEKLAKTQYPFAHKPAFLVIGETSSGKSLAIDKSSIKWHPDFQTMVNKIDSDKPSKGMNGTIGMEWWFGEEAIIIDTAGEVLGLEYAGEKAAQAVALGSADLEGKAWETLLSALKDGRDGRRPFNGVILFVPADSLMNDAPATREAKATATRNRLVRLRDKFGLRFPVWVVVSKADLALLGFTEFVNGVPLTNIDPQMFGWSNGASLDRPFAADEVGKHFSDLAERLERWRLGMLRPTAPLKTAAIAGAELFYAFPEQLRVLGERLAEYLGHVFYEDPNTTLDDKERKALAKKSRQPMVRGVYLTSSLQTGQFKEAMTGANQRGDAGVRTVQRRLLHATRPLFIKDLFAERILKEWRLITPDPNISKARRNRVLKWSATGALAGMIVLGTMWWTGGALRASDEMKGAWTRLNECAAIIDEKGDLHPPRAENATRDKDAIAKAWSTVLDDVQRATKPIEVPAIFRPRSWFDSSTKSTEGGDFMKEERRERAAEIIETKLLTPMLKHVRSRLETFHGKNSAQRMWTPEEDEAIAALVHWSQYAEDAGDQAKRAKWLNPGVLHLVRSTLGAESDETPGAGALREKLTIALGGELNGPKQEKLPTDIRTLTLEQDSLMGLKASIGDLAPYLGDFTEARKYENVKYSLNARDHFRVKGVLEASDTMRETLQKASAGSANAEDGVARGWVKKYSEAMDTLSQGFSHDARLNYSGLNRAITKACEAASKAIGQVVDCPVVMKNGAAGTTGSSYAVELKQSQGILDRIWATRLADGETSTERNALTFLDEMLKTDSSWKSGDAAPLRIDSVRTYLVSMTSPHFVDGSTCGRLGWLAEEANEIKARRDQLLKGIGASDAEVTGQMPKGALGNIDPSQRSVSTGVAGAVAEVPVETMVSQIRSSAFGKITGEATAATANRVASFRTWIDAEAAKNKGKGTKGVEHLVLAESQSPSKNGEDAPAFLAAYARFDIEKMKLLARDLCVVASAPMPPETSSIPQPSGRDDEARCAGAWMEPFDSIQTDFWNDHDTLIENPIKPMIPTGTFSQHVLRLSHASFDAIQAMKTACDGANARIAAGIPSKKSDPKLVASSVQVPKVSVGVEDALKAALPSVPNEACPASVRLAEAKSALQNSALKDHPKVSQAVREYLDAADKAANGACRSTRMETIQSTWNALKRPLQPESTVDYESWDLLDRDFRQVEIACSNAESLNASDIDYPKSTIEGLRLVKDRWSALMKVWKKHQSAEVFVSVRSENLAAGIQDILLRTEPPNPPTAVYGIDERFNPDMGNEENKKKCLRWSLGEDAESRTFQIGARERRASAGGAIPWRSRDESGRWFVLNKLSSADPKTAPKLEGNGYFVMRTSADIWQEWAGEPPFPGQGGKNVQIAKYEVDYYIVVGDAELREALKTIVGSPLK